MAKVRRESHACTGRGFSKTDPAIYGDDSSGGFMSRLLSFAIRPNIHGSTTLITSSTFATSTFNLVGHGLTTGQSVALTSPGGEAAGFTGSFELSTSLAYPLGRANYTEYFVIKLTNDTFQLAISHYNAMKAVPVPITFSADIVAVSITLLGGGANWYLHDDFSRMETVDFATTAVDTTAETITLTGNAFSNMHKVTFSSTGTVPGGLVAGTAYWLYTVSAGVYKVCSTEANAFAGTGINLTSQGTGTHTITTAEHFVIVTDTLNPVVNDYNTSPCGIAPKFLKLGYLNSESGFVRMQGYLWWDNSEHIGRVIWSGYRMDTYDSAVFSYQFIIGDELFFTASQLGASWYNQYIDTFTGLSSKLEAITNVGVLQSGVTAGSSVSLQLNVGEASNFTVNKYYYLYDFNGHGWINYVKVTARDTVADTVTIDSCSVNFPSGAILTPYAHRYYARGIETNNSGTAVQITNMNYSTGGAIIGWTIPYCSSDTETSVFHQQASIIYLRISFADSSTSADSYLGVGDPDDEGYYDCMRHLICEDRDSANASTSMNRIYGKSNNIFKTARGTMGLMTNYRTLNAVDYLNFSSGSTTYVDMVIYSESGS